MKLSFTKMQGAGNDFVVIDSTKNEFALTREQLRKIADRHLGVGADQILVVERPQERAMDFRYRIFNADGGEVEQCGNGARCFVKFVTRKALLPSARSASRRSPVLSCRASRPMARSASRWGRRPSVRL